MFKKFTHQFHILKITFKNRRKVKTTHSNMPVGVKAAEIIKM